MKYTVQIVEPTDSIQAKINNTIAEDMNKLVAQRLNKLVDEVRKETFLFFSDTEIFRLLSDGLLAGHFGFYKGTGNRIAQTVVKQISDSIQVKYNKFVGTSLNIDGSILFFILVEDFSDILGLDVASYRSNQYNIPWLEWLLLHGSEIIISDHRIQFNTGSGRSKQAVMITSGRGWSVPIEFAGTSSDNWLTRRLLDNIDEYINMLEGLIDKILLK